MKQYVIDDIRLEDHGKLKRYLDERYGNSGVDGLYWLPLPEDLLTPLQKAHKECAPFYFSVELTEDRLCCELLVRTKKRMRCDCIAYAAEAQRNWIIDVADAFLAELEIIN